VRDGVTAKRLPWTCLPAGRRLFHHLPCVCACLLVLVTTWGDKAMISSVGR
jgi:hypothetical protein